MVALADWLQGHLSTNPISTWEHFPVSMEYDEDPVSPYCCSMCASSWSPTERWHAIRINAHDWLHCISVHGWIDQPDAPTFQCHRILLLALSWDFTWRFFSFWLDHKWFLDYCCWTKNHIIRDHLLLFRIFTLTTLGGLRWIFLPLPPSAVALDLWDTTTWWAPSLRFWWSHRGYPWGLSLWHDLYYYYSCPHLRLAWFICVHKKKGGGVRKLGPCPASLAFLSSLYLMPSFLVPISTEDHLNIWTPTSTRRLDQTTHMGMRGL